jgi:rhodanese-related sulfurtransferase
MWACPSLILPENIMPSESLEAALPALLERARADALANHLSFAGSVSPPDAWALASNGDAVLVDVRSIEERVFVGRVAGSVHVPWASGTALTRNPRFVRELEAKLKGKQQPVLLLCRSGRRSVLAAQEAAKAGFALTFSVLEGFEGDADERQQRGHRNGWRWHGLPWTQD